MPGQRGSETRQRNHMYTVRWSAEEFARLEEIAAESGCGKADVLRRLVAFDHGGIVPTRALTQQIAAVGNNLNQIARSLHTPKLQPAPATSAGMLAQLQQIEADFRQAHSAMVAIRAQMEKWR